MLLDLDFRLVERQARHKHAAVGAEVDRAVGAHEVLAGDLLLAGGLGERERHLRLLEHTLQVLEDGILGLFERLVAHHHFAVGGAEVEHPTRLHHIEAVDRLLEERALDDHLERVKRLNLERRLGHYSQRVDQQNVRRLDHVSGERDLREFLGGHPLRLSRALGVEHHLLRG